MRGGLLVVGAFLTVASGATLAMARRRPHPYDRQPYRGSDLDEVMASSRRFGTGAQWFALVLGVGCLTAALVTWIAG